MTPKHVDSTTGISKVALLLGLVSGSLFILFSFGSADVQLFDAGEELIAGPVLSFTALLIAFFAYSRTNKRDSWNYAAVAVGAVILMLWFGLNVLLYLAYSNCPNGLC